MFMTLKCFTTPLRKVNQKLSNIYDRNETITYINQELAKRNISQKELADILNITESSISYKLSGKRDFKLQELIIIADLFDMDLMKLIKFIEKADE